MTLSKNHQVQPIQAGQLPGKPYGYMNRVSGRSTSSFLSISHHPHHHTTKSTTTFPPKAQTIPYYPTLISTPPHLHCTTVRHPNMTIIGEVKAEDMQLVVMRPDLHEDLPEFERVKVESPPPVVKDVQLARAYGVAGTVESDHPQEITSWYIQGVGDLEAGCAQCVHANRSVRAKPFFAECKTYGTLQSGACGSCVMKHDAAGCSLSKSCTFLLFPMSRTTLMSWRHQKVLGAALSTPS